MALCPSDLGISAGKEYASYRLSLAQLQGGFLKFSGHHLTEHYLTTRSHPLCLLMRYVIVDPGPYSIAMGASVGASEVVLKIMGIDGLSHVSMAKFQLFGVYLLTLKTEHDLSFFSINVAPRSLQVAGTCLCTLNFPSKNLASECSVSLPAESLKPPRNARCWPVRGLERGPRLWILTTHRNSGRVASFHLALI